MIALHQVHKSFGTVHAVRGVSLEIPAGQVVGVLGPNGAGKTTTIRMITGAIPPSRGRVTLAGLSTVEHSIQVRRRLGYLPDSAPLYREMRVIDYLHYRGRLFGLARPARRAAIQGAVARCKLGDVERRRIGQLSKGFRQRVGLASVLLHDPPVLILDEPTSGLDPAQIAEMRSLIRELAGNRTMLIVSHILPEVEKSCDRIVLFARGRIQADGPPEGLIRALPGAGRYTLEARPVNGGGAAPAKVLAALSGLESIESSDLGEGWSRVLLGFAPMAGDQREPIARAAAGAGLLVRELRPQAATLEDVYLRLVAYAEQADEDPASAATPPPSSITPALPAERSA